MKHPPREVPHNTLNDHTKADTDEPIPVLITSTEVPNGKPEGLFTRKDSPHKAERVTRIMQEITIGPDVTPDQRQIVQEVIAEYADCFALSMIEVNTIPRAVHKLNIPEGATFQTKIPPRSYNPDQHAFVDAKVDEMLEAGIIRLIHPSEVKFVAQTVLAKKVHEDQGLDIDELKYKVNDQCLKSGFPDEFEMPPQPELKPECTTPENVPTK